MVDKESCTVILNQVDYIDNISKIIDEGIANGKCIETSDTTHVGLKCFQDFLDRNFKYKKYYDNMRPVSNQPAHFFATGKTYKFKTIEEINFDDLKLLFR